MSTRYANLTLPKAIVDKIDAIVAQKGSSYRSRPDFVLHHLRPIVEEIIENMKKKDHD